MAIEGEPVISCGNCVGACCRAPSIIQLTNPEAEFLTAGGTDLNAIVDATEAEDLRNYHGTETSRVRLKEIAMTLPDNVGEYEILGACGYLALDPDSGVGVCTVYTHPERPLACAIFKVGSEVCVNFRKRYGLPT